MDIKARHDQLVREMEDDPDICKTCGGWLGRKPGVKPYCTASGCPGRTAPKPDQNAIEKREKERKEREKREKQEEREREEREMVERAKRATASPTKAERSGGGGGLFPYAKQDTDEELAIKRSTYMRVKSDIDGYNRRGGGRSSSGDYLCKPLVECGRSCAAWWSSCLEAVGTFIWNTLARLLGLANIIAIGVLLLYTILEPMMPSGPGAAPKTVELCVDYQGGWFPFRWDRANVGAGPCFALGVAFVGGGGAT